MTRRKDLFIALKKVIELLHKSEFHAAIDQIFLLGSFFSPKSFPNDLDLMLIGSFQIRQLSVLRTQEHIKELLFSAIKVPLSINFGSSIESIVFADGIPIEKYLLIYSRSHQVNWEQWFTEMGKLRYPILRCFSAIDTPVLRYLDDPISNIISIYIADDQSIYLSLECIVFPRVTLWKFLIKRCNLTLEQSRKDFFHPLGWKECKRSGNCCKDFNDLKDRFLPEIPRIYDIIQRKYGGVLWNSIPINSEHDLFWLVEVGLKSDEIKRLKENIQVFDNSKPLFEKLLVQEVEKEQTIPCPFWRPQTYIGGSSTCEIWDVRPDACARFPDFSFQLLMYKCSG